MSIFTGIGTLAKEIGADIVKVFDGGVHELETIILPAVTAVTNALKTIIDGDQGDIIGKLVGASGAALEDKVRAALDLIVPKLQLAQQFLSGGGDSATILANIVKLVGASPAETQTAFWIEFSGMLAKALAAGITPAQAVILEQWFYANYKPGAAAAPASPAPATPTTQS